MEEAISPLRQKSLRLPGQSLDDTINALFDDRGMFLFLLPVTLMLLLGVEWFRWRYPAPAAPWFMTIVVALISVICYLRFFRLLKQVKCLRLGRDGERAVAEVLDGLREQGCRVFHDVVGPDFNVDHVVVGPQGVFVIETKTIRKPVRNHQAATVKFVGNAITAGGANLGLRPPTKQRPRRARIFGLLKEGTGKTYPVKPCVVFPGWFVEPMGKEAAQGTWVLNPKALPTFIHNEPARIQDEDLHLAVFHLSTFIRSPWAADDSAFAKALLKRGRTRRPRMPATR